MINNTNAFKALKKHLEAEGDTATLVETTRPSDFVASEVAKAAVSTADFILTGMASSRELSLPEITAVRAAKVAGKTYGFFSDWPGAIVGRGRGWFEEFLRSASAVFLVHTSDEEAAKELCPRAKVVVTGHPKDEGAGEVTKNRGEVLQYLRISLSEYVVFCTGTKTRSVNESVLRMISDVVGALGEQSPYFVFAQHPGEEGVGASDYKKFGVRVIPKGTKFSDGTPVTAELFLPAADIFLNIAGTAVSRAGYLRIPTLWALTPEVREILEKNSGSRSPLECQGAYPVAVPVQMHWELSGNVGLIRNGNLRNELIQRMEKHYPLPTPAKGTAVRAMSEAIRSIVGKP